MPSQAGESSWHLGRPSAGRPRRLPICLFGQSPKDAAHAPQSRAATPKAARRSAPAIIDECLVAGATFARSDPMSHDDEKPKAKHAANRCVCCGCDDSLTPQSHYPLARILRRADIIRSVSVRRSPTQPSCPTIPAPKASHGSAQQEVSPNKVNHCPCPQGPRRMNRAASQAPTVSCRTRRTGLLRRARRAAKCSSARAGRQPDAPYPGAEG